MIKIFRAETSEKSMYGSLIVRVNTPMNNGDIVVHNNLAFTVYNDWDVNDFGGHEDIVGRVVVATFTNNSHWMPAAGFDMSGYQEYSDHSRVPPARGESTGMPAFGNMLWSDAVNKKWAEIEEQYKKFANFEKPTKHVDGTFPINYHTPAVCNIEGI